jgi:hypothetical protein
MLFPERGIELWRRLDPLNRFQANLTPLVHQPSTNHLVGLINTAIIKIELDAVRTSFLQERPCFGATGLDIF